MSIKLKRWEEREQIRTATRIAKLVAALLRVAGVIEGWRKVMASYCRVYDSHHLQADCKEPGSAPERSLITRLRLHVAGPCTKFEVSSISRCGDISQGVTF